MSDFGSFICNSCHTEFDKAGPSHGSSGKCCQCEIAHGILLLHGDDKEANEREQRRTKVAIARYVMAFNGRPA